MFYAHAPNRGNSWIQSIIPRSAARIRAISCSSVVELCPPYLKKAYRVRGFTARVNIIKPLCLFLNLGIKLEYFRPSTSIFYQSFKWTLGKLLRGILEPIVNCETNNKCQGSFGRNVLWGPTRISLHSQLCVLIQGGYCNLTLFMH